MTEAVSCNTLCSLVKSLPHVFLNAEAQPKCPIPTRPDTAKATMAARRAPSPEPLPNSFPTLVETEELKPNGIVYISEVVCINMAVLATASLGFSKYPASMVSISYHHHSKQIAQQLGMASFNNGHHSRKTSFVGQPFHVLLYAPEYFK